MVLQMKVPSPGESITEVEIASWLVKDGDFVEKDQPIAEVDSDKATLELPAEDSGVITLKAAEGDVIKVGDVVCLIDTSAQKTAENSTPKVEEKKEEAKAVETPKPEAKEESKPTYATGTPSPAAAKILDEKGISATEVNGTGKDGRITKEDAVQAKAAMGSVSDASANRKQTSSKFSMLRRKIAERLVAVKNETAMLTTFNEVDMSALYKIRADYKEEFKQKHEVGLGFMSFFTLACVKALKDFPDVNAMIDGDYKISYEYADIGVAVSSPKGLMVPILRNAENLSFRGVEEEIKRLAIKARDGQMTVDEMTGGTFTITNGGVFGSMLSTPILNPPQSAILGMHNVVDRPVAVNGKVEIRPIMYLALSYDHRIIDGKEAVGFLVAIKEAVENPAEILMGGNVKKALEL